MKLFTYDTNSADTAGGVVTSLINTRRLQLKHSVFDVISKPEFLKNAHPSLPA